MSAALAAKGFDGADVSATFADAAVPPARVRPARVRAECGDLPFVIKRDGTWLYRGSPIGRKELVCLFASVLSAVPPSDLEARMARELRFDPDLWWIAIDDRLGRTFLPLAPGS